MSRNQVIGMALVASAAGTLTLASCSDRPTEPRVRTPQASAPSLDRDPAKHPNKQRAALLTDVSVTGTLADGGRFIGTFTAKHIDMDPVTRQLTLEGILNGTATKATGEVVNVVDAAFSAPMTLRREGAPPGQLVRPAAMQAVCDILFLDLGPLHLDLLGLTLDLAEVILDLNAVSGGGNLLGNLLCALVGLLDITAIIAQLSQIIDLINQILAGLNNPGVGGAALTAPVLLHSVFSTFSA